MLYLRLILSTALTYLQVSASYLLRHVKHEVLDQRRKGNWAKHDVQGWMNSVSGQSIWRVYQSPIQKCLCLFPFQNELIFAVIEAY